MTQRGNLVSVPQPVISSLEPTSTKEPMSANTRNELLKEIQHRRVLGAKAVVVSVSLDLPHGGPSSSVCHSLRAKIIQLGNTPPNTMIAYSAAHVLLITDENKAFAVTQELTRIGEFLVAQHLGSLKFRAFRIPNESYLLFAALEPEAGSEAHLLHISDPSPSERIRDFDTLLDIEQILRDADLTNIIRERPVYAFAKDGQTTLVQRELVVDMSEVARVARTGFHGRAWLFSEVAGLLDRQMLAHFVRERQNDEGKLSINLLVRTVLSDAFADFLRQVSDAAASRLSCELDFHEIQAFPKAAGEAVNRLRDAGLTVVVDAVPIDHLEGAERALPAINGQYKFEWRNSLLLDSEAFNAANYLADKKWRLSDLGVDKCVLLHCHTPRVIENALALGFTHLEGFEVTPYVRRHAILPDEA